MTSAGNSSVKKVGIAAVLGASLMWAIEPSLAKLASRSSGVIQTVSVRVVFTALTALIYAVLTDRKGLRVAGKHLPKLAYIALAGTVFADLMYFRALMSLKVPVLNAVLIGHMQPVFVVFIGFLVLREDRLTRYDYLGIVVLLAAGLFVSTKTPSRLARMQLGTLGDLFVLAATFAWATAGIVMRKYLRAMGAGSITFYRFALASIALIVLGLFTEPLAITSIYQVLVGVVVGAGYILYYEGLKRIKAAQVAALELSTPFFAALLGFAILGEKPEPMQILGIALLFLGVYLLSRTEEMPF
jgi:drug/metabolite transporter (DMT)-like permease